MKSIKLFNFFDIFLIILLLTACFFGFKIFNKSGTPVAVITVGGEETKIDLNSVVDPYDINYEHFSIRVESGRICFFDSDCRDKTCKKSGWLTSAGDFAACVPNGACIRIVGNSSYDGVTQ